MKRNVHYKSVRKNVIDKLLKIKWISGFNHQIAVEVITKGWPIVDVARINGVTRERIYQIIKSVKHKALELKSIQG